MGRKSTESSLIIKDLALQHGKTERWARKQRQLETAIWKEYMGKLSLPSEDEAKPVTGKGENQSIKVDHEGTGFDQELSDLQKAESICVESWVALEGLQKTLKECLNDKNLVALVPTYTRSVKDARKQWEDAIKHRDAILAQEGYLISIERVNGVRTHLKVLTDFFQGLRMTISSKLPPDQRHDFYGAFEEAMPEWNSGIERVDSYLKSIMPC